VASAGPYASLHLAPDRQPDQHPTTLFLQAGCPSCRPTNSVKALKGRTSLELNEAKADGVLEWNVLEFLDPSYNQKVKASAYLV